MLVVFCLIGFFFKMIPTAYVPDEDQSFMLVSASPASGCFHEPVHGLYGILRSQDC